MSVKIDFRLENGENRGIYYPDTERILIYPIQHENIEDLLATINHELIHYAVDKADEEMDDDQEEKVIYKIQWVDEWIN